MHGGKVDPVVSELPMGNELSRDHVSRPLVFLSVVFAFEHGISESNNDSKFECRSVNDFKHNRTHGQQQSKPVVSYKQSGSRKTILLLRKNVKLVIKYALLYRVTSLMLLFHNSVNV